MCVMLRRSVRSKTPCGDTTITTSSAYGGRAMTSHAYRPGDSVSAARITAYCGVVIALITTIGGIASLVLNRNSVDSKGPLTAAITSAAITSAPTATSLPNGAPDTGLRFSPLINGKLTVSGSTLNDVTG